MVCISCCSGIMVIRLSAVTFATFAFFNHFAQQVKATCSIGIWNKLNE